MGLKDSVPCSGEIMGYTPGPCSGEIMGYIPDPCSGEIMGYTPGPYWYIQKILYFGQMSTEPLNKKFRDNFARPMVYAVCRGEKRMREY
jgi:hypothetical protein